MTELSGGCLCKKVRYKISQPPISQGICYCRQCQKAGSPCGNPLLVLHRSTIEITPDTISYCQTVSDRGSTVIRNFCKDCGTHVFSQISDIPDILTVKAATLDDVSAFTPEYLVWTESAGASSVFPANVPSFPKNAPIEMLLNLK